MTRTLTHNTHIHKGTEPPNSNSGSNSNIKSISKKRKSHRLPASDAGTPNMSTSSSKSKNFRDDSAVDFQEKAKNELVASEEDDQSGGEHTGLTTSDEDEDDEEDDLFDNRGTGNGGRGGGVGRGGKGVDRGGKGGGRGRGGRSGDSGQGASLDAGTPKRNTTSRKSINFRGGSTGQTSNDDGGDGAFAASVKSMKEKLTVQSKNQGRDGGGGSDRGGGRARGGKSNAPLQARTIFLNEFQKKLDEPTQVHQEDPNAALSTTAGKGSNTEKPPRNKRRSTVVLKKIRDKLNTTLALIVASYSLATCRAAPNCVYPASFKLQECSEERHAWMRNLVPIVEVVPSKNWEDYSWECAKNDDDGSVIEGLFVDSQGESYTSLPQLLEVILLFV
jgi:hypothetical protein